jgi:hypothetical protein
MHCARQRALVILVGFTHVEQVVVVKACRHVVGIYLIDLGLGGIK